jgi:transcriptional regulator with XRE-family HTH domain
VSSFRIAQKSLAVNVKRLRLAKGITQEELAFLAEIDRTYASQIERAIANPSLGIICAVADALGTTYEKLLVEIKLPLTH